jgi:nicotinamide-nucleotide amidase
MGPDASPPTNETDGGDDGVAERLVTALDDAGERVAVAEAHTGGAVCARLIAVPGASAALERGWVVYGRDAPRTELGVTRETLDDYGAVSAAVARELAARARDRADAAWGLSTTGIAGPSGGTDDKPVGTAFVGVARGAPWETGDSFTRATRHAFGGDRAAVIARSAGQALAELLDAVEDGHE